MTTSARPNIPWWLILLQGILSLLVGIALFTTPGTAMVVLVRILGWAWLIRGIFAITAIFNPEAKDHRGWLTVNGLLGIVAGFLVLDHPLLSAVLVPAMVVTFIGVAGVMIGVNDLFAAFRGAGWGVGLVGVLTIVLGGSLLGNTYIGVAALPFVLGSIEVVAGAAALAFSFRLRSAQQQPA